MKEDVIYLKSYDTREKKFFLDCLIVSVRPSNQKKSRYKYICAVCLQSMLPEKARNVPTSSLCGNLSLVNSGQMGKFDKRTWQLLFTLIEYCDSFGTRSRKHSRCTWKRWLIIFDHGWIEDYFPFVVVKCIIYHSDWKIEFERFSLGNTRNWRLSIGDKRNERFILKNTRDGRISLENTRNERFSLRNTGM